MQESYYVDVLHAQKKPLSMAGLRFVWTTRHCLHAFMHGCYAYLDCRRRLANWLQA
jgi:hypothetical protein